mgnify:FL=1|tara:strand:+ start:147 stop:761 length:615 start_codon:yes stop_codon:yes gene_type:complete
MVGQVIGGLTGIASGAIGSGKRKRELRDAQAGYDRRKGEYEGLDTSNVYDDMENTMEDQTVNTQQADFQAQQSQQGLSNIMGSMQGAAGGSGLAALAQSLAGQQQNQTRQASMDIGRQEQSNQAAERQQASNLQLYERKGELISRDAELEKTETLLGMSQQRLGAANAAKQEATNSIVGGVGSLASAGAGFIPGGSTLGKILGN